MLLHLHSPDDFEKTLETAIYNSGDSDTVGSIACSISGANNGALNIPMNLLTSVENYDEKDDLIFNFALIFCHSESK